MPLPLLPDLRAQAPALRRFLLKVALFLGLFGLLDRAVGVVLKSGIEKYYKLNRTCDVLFLGHSRTKCAINEAELARLTGLRVSKFAMDGANAQDRKTMLQFYLGTHLRPHVIFYDVNAFTFAKPDPPSAGSYQNFYPFMGDSKVRSYVASRATSWPEWACRTLFASARYNERTVQKSILGYLGKAESTRGSLNIAQLQAKLSKGDFRPISIDSEYLTAFEDTLKFGEQAQVPIILFYLPHCAMLNATEPKKYKNVMEKLKSYAGAEGKPRFLDYNTPIEERDDLFADPIHLNESGRRVVTEMLSRDIPRLLEGDRPPVVVPSK